MTQTIEKRPQVKAFQTKKITPFKGAKAIDYKFTDVELSSWQQVSPDSSSTEPFIKKKWKEWARDPVKWLEEQCFTKDESHPDGIRPFPQKDYIRALVYLTLTNGFTVVNKARRMLASHVAACLALHHLIFIPNAKVVIISKDLDAAKAILEERVKEVYKYLDPRMPYPKLRPNRELKAEEIINPENGSRIEVYSSTASGCRGVTGTLIILDEFAYHYDQENLLASVLPALQGERTHGLAISTPDYGTHFVNMIKNVPQDVCYEEMIPGLTTFINKEGHFIVDLDYKADPDKATLEWYYRERYATTPPPECKRIPGAIPKDSIWEREYERSLTSTTGEPCFPMFKKALHCEPYMRLAQSDSVRGAILRLSFDFGGVNPAALIAQKDSINRTIIHQGIMSWRTQLPQFLEIVGNYILEHFSHCCVNGEWRIQLYADVAGNRPSNQGTGDPAFQVLFDFFKKKFNYNGEIFASYTSPSARVQACRTILSTISYDTPTIVVNPSAGIWYDIRNTEPRYGVLVEGFESGYRFEDAKKTKGVDSGEIESNKPKKDGVFEHLMDCFTNMICDKSMYPITQYQEHGYNETKSKRSGKSSSRGKGLVGKRFGRTRR